MTNLAFYGSLLGDIKTRIRQAQTRAALAANTELVHLYWDIGRMIRARQKAQGWGKGVIPRLARDLHNELPEVKGFSERNIRLMVQFSQEYPALFKIWQFPIAKLKMDRNTNKNTALPMAQIPWTQNVLLLQRVKDLPARLWYAQQAIREGWNSPALCDKIKKRAFDRRGSAVSNFSSRLPAHQSDLAGQLLKDPYLFDFLTLEEPFHERELETGLMRHLEKFLLELGQGFAYVGRQYRLEVGGREFYLDLLFYHLSLRCFVVVDLKKGDFKPEYAGKMNFYCSVVDDKLKHAADHPTIGLILCQTKDRILAEYSLRDIHKPISVADYDLARALPKEIASRLPSIEQIEAELQSEVEGL